MSQFIHLIFKDLKRARRNPWQQLIFIAIPLLITGLIGFVFGGSSKGEGLGKMKIAVVDLDESLLGSVMRSSFNQGESNQYLEPVFTDESGGDVLIKENKVSAMLVIPKGFTGDYLHGRVCQPIRLVKNPAQSFYPAIIEELMRTVSTALNAVSRNFKDELPMVLEVVEKEGTPDFIAMSQIMIRLQSKFEQAEDYLFPPLITYGSETRSNPEEEKKKDFNLFGFLLPMLSSMFLLFLADGSMRDIYKEQRGGTLDRFRTTTTHLGVFVGSKMVFAVVVMLIGSVILFVGGGWVFGIEWKHPFKITLLCIGFALAGAGINAILIALARNERRSDMLNGIVMLSIAMMGGSAFQVEALPGFIRNYLSPWLPNYWFIQAIQNIEFQTGHTDWWLSLIKLAGLGLVLMMVSASILQRFYSQGVKS